MDKVERNSEYIRSHFTDVMSVLNRQMDDLLSEAEFKEAEEMTDDLEALVMKYAKEENDEK